MNRAQERVSPGALQHPFGVLTASEKTRSRARFLRSALGVAGVIFSAGASPPQRMGDHQAADGEEQRSSGLRSDDGRHQVFGSSRGEGGANHSRSRSASPERVAERAKVQRGNSGTPPRRSAASSEAATGTASRAPACSLRRPCEDGPRWSWLFGYRKLSDLVEQHPGQRSCESGKVEGRQRISGRRDVRQNALTSSLLDSSGTMGAQCRFRIGARSPALTAAMSGNGGVAERQGDHQQNGDDNGDNAPSPLCTATFFHNVE